MRCRRYVFLICIAIVLWAGLSAIGLAAHPENTSAQGIVQEGQIFVIKLIPAGRRVEFMLTGKRVASIDFESVGVTASLELGDKRLVLPMKRKGNRFELEALPVTAGESMLKLHLNLKLGNEVEDFVFQMPAVRL